MIQRARGDLGFQRDVWIRCSRDIVFYCDAFGWTYNPKDYEDQPNRPFILHDIQEYGLTKLKGSIGKHDALIEKSRTMGASWICLIAFIHSWHFKPRQSFLLGSRTQEYVDKAGNPKSLFWKIDYFLEKLPSWMVPRYERTSMHLGNLENDSIIDGESTTGDFATGDRRTAVLLDEFAKIEGDGYSILRATQHVTRCRIFNSTPQGASGAYYEERHRISKNFPDQIIRLHWSDHPEYNRGLYTTKGGVEGGELVILDKEYEFPADFEFVRDGKLRSPWYDNECKRSPSKQFIAQELDIDYVGAGGTFFDPSKIEQIISQCARLPITKGEIAYELGTTKVRWIDHRMHGRLWLWTVPGLDYRPIPGKYVVGCDIATGKGGDESTNSVASIVNQETGEKVGQFTTNQMNPTEFARTVVAICRWFHTAFLIWEDNGPGGEFGVEVRNLGYRHVFYREDEKLFDRSKTNKAGWYSTRETKKLLLANYAHALMESRFVNHCEQALRECLEYVYDSGGQIVHSRAEASKNPMTSGENHGDMVIADALAFRGVIDIPVVAEYTRREVPEGSFAHRREQSRRAARQRTSW